MLSHSIVKFKPVIHPAIYPDRSWSNVPKLCTTPEQYVTHRTAYNYMPGDIVVFQPGIKTMCKDIRSMHLVLSVEEDFNNLKYDLHGTYPKFLYLIGLGRWDVETQTASNSTPYQHWSSVLNLRRLESEEKELFNNDKLQNYIKAIVLQAKTGQSPF